MFRDSKLNSKIYFKKLYRDAFNNETYIFKTLIVYPTELHQCYLFSFVIIINFIQHCIRFYYLLICDSKRVVLKQSRNKRHV